MPPRSPSDDQGSAAIEFLLLSLALLVPLVYLVLALGSIQSHALGVEAASRHLARTMAVSADPVRAQEASERVVAHIAREYGIDPQTITVSVSCSDVTASCPSAGTIVRVTVTAEAVLPLVPPLLGLDQIARVPVEAAAAHKVSRLWMAP